MLELSWTPDAGGPEQTIDLDLLERDTNELSAHISDHPVEQGAAITDHVRAENETLTFEGMVTNTPVTPMVFGMDGASGSVQPQTITVGGQSASVSVLTFSQAFDRVKAVSEKLRELQKVGQVFTVTTSRRSVENCVIARFHTERAAEQGSSTKITLEMRVIRVATTERVRVPAPRQRRGQRNQNRGSQPGEEQSTERRSSFLRRAQNSGLAGLFGG